MRSQGRFFDPFSLMRKRGKLIASVAFVLGILAASFAEGAIQKVGLFVIAAWAGIVVYGFFLDPQYLTQTGVSRSATGGDDTAAEDMYW